MDGRDVPGEAINLADVADFTVGVLVVQPSLRRVMDGQREESVEPRVMQALIALSEAAGAVVSRDALIDRCWSGRIVGDDAINRCIAKVRRLADTTCPPAFSVETVSKVGYRLIVLRQPERPHAIDPAAWRSADLPTASGKPVVRRRRQGLVWTVMCLAILAGAGAALRSRQHHPGWVVRSSRRVLPNLDGQTSPRISPDGLMLAYVAEVNGRHRQIFVGDLREGTSRPISRSDEDSDSPSWSSDGKRLAYAVAGSAGEPCRIIVTLVSNGTPNLVGRCQHAHRTQITWQQGSSYILLEDRVPVLDGQFSGFFDAVFRINIENGRSEQVTSPFLSESDYGPRISPDGVWLAYVRGLGIGEQTLRLRKLAGSEERELDCNPDVRSVDWAPDSQTLIASVPGPTGSEILACPINGAHAYRVYASASRLGRVAAGPHGLLAVEVDERRRNLARASVTPRAAADVIDPAAGTTDWPAFASDGTLAFISNRSGEPALWIRKPGGDPVELLSAGTADIERPVWSPDASRIAYVQVSDGDIVVRVCSASGKSLVAFPVPSIGFGMPNWAPDGEHLVMFDKHMLQAVWHDVRDPSHPKPVQDRLWDGVIYRNGAVYSVHGTKGGIWQLDGGPRLITGNYPTERRARLAFAGNDVLLPDSEDGGDLRILAQPLNGMQAHVGFYAPAAEPQTPIAVSPMTGDVIYVAEVANDSHIDLLTMARQ